MTKALFLLEKVSSEKKKKTKNTHNYRYAQNLKLVWTSRATTRRYEILFK